MTPTVVLVTGGRKYALERTGVKERQHVYITMDSIRAHYGEIMVVVGGAPGLDKCVELWCEDKSVHCAVVRALWNRLGPSAGPRRNSAMLLLTPGVCVGFPGGVGTADMLRKARAAGVPTWEV